MICESGLALASAFWHLLVPFHVFSSASGCMFVHLAAMQGSDLSQAIKARALPWIDPVQVSALDCDNHFIPTFHTNNTESLSSPNNTESTSMYVARLVLPCL